MSQKNQNRNRAIALVMIAIMILGGGVTLVSSYFATRSKSISILIFAAVWIVMLLVAMLRIILDMIKSKKDALDDMQQYYEHQEEVTFQNARSVPKAKKKMYMKRIVISILMMALSSIVVVPVLIASRSFAVVLIVCLWHYGLLVRDIVLNVKRMKNAEDDPADNLQQIVQGDVESSAMQLQRSMAVCPYCGGKSPEGFVNCCHCGRKLSVH